MPQLNQHIHSVPGFLAMQVEERARVLLQFINAHFPKAQSVHRKNILNVDALRGWLVNREELGPLRSALTEAWIWLEREILVAPHPDQDRDWVYVTERGQTFLQRGSAVEWNAAGLLLRERLDPVLAEEIGAAFRRGDFTRAVGNAFLTVELRVRKLANIGDANVKPRDLAWLAFRPEDPPSGKPPGRIADPVEEKDEAEGTCDLFSGAMRRFRNPHLHARLPVNTAEEAIRLIQFADLLLTMAEDHAEAAKGRAQVGGDTPPIS